jgi:hypothetical protein
MNRFGEFSRASYDGSDVYISKMRQTTSPMQYRLNSNQISNNNKCVAPLGPRPSKKGHEMTLPNHDSFAPSQNGDVINIESILSNRNVPISKSPKLGANPINIMKYKLKNPTVCGNELNPSSSRLTTPIMTYRELSINRFYDLPIQPQNHIFYDFAANTRLETTDNFSPPEVDVLNDDPSLPRPKAQQKSCKVVKFCVDQ